MRISLIAYFLSLSLFFSLPSYQKEIKTDVCTLCSHALASVIIYISIFLFKIYIFLPSVKSLDFRNEVC